MLKAIKIIVPLFIVAMLILGFVVWKTKSDNSNNLRLTEEALNLGNEYVKIYNGTFEASKLNSDVVTEEVKDYIISEQQNLESKDEGYFDLDTYFYQYTEEFGGDVIKEADTYDVVYVDDTLVEDERIQYIDDKAVIPLAQLDPDNAGQDSINYNGVMLKLDMTEAEQTYSKMISNPTNNYIYVTHELFKSKSSTYIDILYKSVVGDSSLSVRCYTDKGKISKLEVNQ